jgi:hypothetical protein
MPGKGQPYKKTRPKARPGSTDGGAVKRGNSAAKRRAMEAKKDKKAGKK